MNAVEARNIATKVISDGQDEAGRLALAQIADVASRGGRQAIMTPAHAQWLKTFLEALGYTCTNSTSPRDGTLLTVNW